MQHWLEQLRQLREIFVVIVQALKPAVQGAKVFGVIIGLETGGKDFLAQPGKCGTIR